MGGKGRAVGVGRNEKVSYSGEHADVLLLASIDRRSSKMLGGLDRAINRLRAIPGIYVAAEKSLLTHTLQRFSAAFGAERIGAWVPNDDADLHYWLSQPVRQITTDRPDLALRARHDIAT
jgi:glycerophosphoryl diester phosphodiesterase